MSDAKKGSPGRSGKTSSPAAKRPVNGVALEQLRAENEQLKQRIRHLEEEREAYRKAVYAWAREQFPPEDFRRALAEKDGLPLSAFLGQLEREARGS